MEIRNNAEGLKTLLGVPSTPPAKVQQTGSGNSAAQSAFAGDRATLSNAGTEALQASAASGVRMDKVTAVQAALAAGSYSVPATALAGKLVDAMLSGSIGSGS